VEKKLEVARDEGCRRVVAAAIESGARMGEVADKTDLTEAGRRSRLAAARGFSDIMYYKRRRRRRWRDGEMSGGWRSLRRWAGKVGRRLAVLRPLEGLVEMEG
jgi:hypothetical protein